MSARGERRTTAQFDGRWLAAQLQALLGPLARRRLCLGLSGGLDSTVLLSALAPLRARERFHLRALHVNHGLHVNAAQWAQRAAAQARRLRVRFELLPVEVRPLRGASLEALAREARYAALRARLSPGEVLLTAHHLDDQLETLLLALLRGSGLKGLACMPQLAPFGPGLHARPLLPIARAQLEAYAHAQGLSWSEDESNADERFDRNYLRRRVIPAIRLRWPAAAAGANRSASLLAEAQRLLEQAAQPMLAQAIDGAALRVPVLRRLQVPQRRLLLRTWLTRRGLPLPDQRRLQELTGPVLA
ncbi:MAG: tRNA lysidine(34) synthetase TilS, partial [Steroidobacterales bacterium]